MKQIGLVVQITFDVVPDESINKESIRSFFEDYANVRSVHYYKRQVQGYVKFYEDNLAFLKRHLASILDRKGKIGDYKFSMKIMQQMTFAGNNF
jgi:hypothetical protein